MELTFRNSFDPVPSAPSRMQRRWTPHHSAKTQARWTLSLRCPPRLRFRQRPERPPPLRPRTSPWLETVAAEKLFPLPGTPQHYASATSFKEKDFAWVPGRETGTLKDEGP
jgi:hypothetical protein